MSSTAWKVTQNSLSELESRLQAEIVARNTDKLPKDLSTFAGSPRPGSGRRPQQLGDITRPEGTPTRIRKPLDLPVAYMIPPVHPDGAETESKLQEIMKMNGILSINGKKYQTDIKDLEHLGELGNGTCGHVVKMLHKPSQTVIAVKQMRRSGNSEENKRIIMDLDVVLKSHDCPFIVQCLGCFITDSDVWICMELMATCFDKLLKRLRKPIPEDMLGKVTFATVKALHYLKESHGVIHRDVKPSNILLDEKGNVKLCDFGISGRLVDSKAKTRSAGCAAYMAPERIDPPDPTKPDYDIRADVWSLGITLVELATGMFPYRDCKTDFEVLTKVLTEDPPNLPDDQTFSLEFHSFVTSCLTKNYKLRPKYKKLLETAFMKKYETKNVNMAAWFAQAMLQCDMNTPGSSPLRKITPPPPPPSSLARRHTPLHSSHHRSASETGARTNGVPSSFQYHRGGGAGDNARTAPPLPQQGFWRTPQPASDNDWDGSRVVGSGFLGSPVPGRKRFPSESPPIQQYAQHNHRHLGNTSPLVLQRFYHQQNQHLQNSHNNHHVLGHAQPHSLPHYHTAAVDVEPPKPPDEPTGGKKRFASYFKMYLGGGESRRNFPPPRPARHVSPGPPPHYPPPSQSPDPPPRLNRGTSVEGGAGVSPLLARRGYLDHSPVRRGFVEGSPSLSRRYISPSPPQPPPRRLSESTSVPGSPQHLRVEHIRARFHYTPEPQRRIFEGGEFQDL